MRRHRKWRRSIKLGAPAGRRVTEMPIYGRSVFRSMVQGTFHRLTMKLCIIQGEGGQQK